MRTKPSKAWITHAKKNARDPRLGQSVRQWYKDELRKLGVKA